MDKMQWPVVVGIFTLLGAIYAQIPKGTFSCEGRTSGYYADVGTGCQVYHMCDGLGRQFSYTCPNATLFQQRMLICDHWYMVNCSKSEEDYSANLLIGQREKPFVEDSETKPYFRTPRPDLLSQPTASEANIIYRNSRTSPSNNIVGAESAATGDPSYSLPSHWSTEYSKDSTTKAPNKVNNYKTSSSFVRTSYNDDTKRSKGKAIDVNSSRNKVNEAQQNRFKSTNNLNKNQQKIGVNFNSNFKATTPVYPKTVDVISDSPEKAGLLPPLSEKFRPDNDKLPKVNFQSDFKATTPVYPKTVDVISDSPEEAGLLPPRSGNRRPNQKTKIKVNFESNFKATTPVYPKTVDVISDSPEDVGILPPSSGSSKVSQEPRFKVNYESNFKATTPVYPKSVDVISDSPEEAGILPPSSGSSKINQKPRINVNFESNFKATTPVYPKTVDVISDSPEEAGILPPRSENKQPNQEPKTKVNFESNFKATTPVYPKAVDVISDSPEEAGILPPQLKQAKTNTQENIVVNFASKFKATTPVYPKTVEAISEAADGAGVLPPLQKTHEIKDNVQVNFKSNFKATTPVYPKSVEPTSPNPEDVGILAPQSKTGNIKKIPSLSLDLEAPFVDDSPVKENRTFAADKPSKFYQPPHFEPDFSQPNAQNSKENLIRKPFDFGSMNSDQWSQLRRDYQIPDYDFPLDAATRPSYDSNFSSFMAKSNKK